MENITLKSMTKFVFMLRNRTTSELCKDFPNAFTLPVWNGNKDDMVRSMLAIDAIQWKLTGNYAKFLMLNSELWMFVPCKLVDGVWIVLEEPKKENFLTENLLYQTDYHTKAIKEYQEAKERVLFEGFSYHIGLDKNNPDFWFVRNSSCKIHDYELEVKKLPLETFANLNYLIELTPTAQKQIGL